MLVITGVLFVLVATLVDLKPVVDQNFFFSTNDPGILQTKKIERRFPSQPEVILAVSSRDISSQRYLSRMQRLTQRAHTIGGVNAVKSLAEGPKSFDDALKSPFWSRLLIAHDRKSSNVIIFMKGKHTEQPIQRLEQIVHELDASDFRIHIAGPPYVVEMLRRSLAHDFRYFSLTAVVLFGLTMAALFRSVRLFVGMLCTCASAVLLTLFLQAMLGHKIGILTVNLGTIVFVIALSHLVYMTFNWQTLADCAHRIGKKSPDLATDARRMTFPPSFWSMVCASLGFASLLIVQAKPLRELGFGGVLGTVVAFACAYLMYPAFLRWAVPRKSKIVEAEPTHAFWSHRFALLSLGVILLGAVLGLGLVNVNTDPSLFEYFKPNQPLRDGIEFVDRTGGSNPLTLVVSSSNGSLLNTDAAYEKMWRLHGALEHEKGVSKSFVTDDRKEAVFMLRMIEARRTKYRVDVVDDLRAVCRKYGFKADLVGGIYYLQGRLAKLVAESLVTGLFWLNLLFIVIAWVVARSVRGAVAMIASLTLVPLSMLGGIGWFHVPVDVISAPATNVCIGIAIDSMIHLIFGVRRAQRDGKKGWDTWVFAREEQWRGIVYSDVIIAAGFAIFVLSDFPPTQRFGLVVLAGCVIDILANLFVLPLLGGAELKKRV